MTITPARRRATTTGSPHRRPHRRHGVPPVDPRRGHTPAAPISAPPAAPAASDARRRPVGRRTYRVAALLRCAVYLGPLSAAVAAAGPLGRVAWPVPLATLLLGWAAAQALTGIGVAVARRAGSAAAARLVAGGFATVAGLWCALAWVAPHRLIGPDRGLALVIGLGGLASLATVTAALVTRSEPAVIGWSVPCWLVAAATLVELAGRPVPMPVPVGTLLPAAIVVATVRAFRPAMLPGRRGRAHRPTADERRRAAGHLVIGAAQALCVGVLWQAAPTGPARVPFRLPLLLAVPILEVLIGWHADRVNTALDTAESGAEFGRRLRGVGRRTLTGLLPPLVVGCALAAAAYRLPAATLAPAGGPDDVLGLAGGMLLGGVFAITFLLARTRLGVAAGLAATPPLALAALSALPFPAVGPLPSAVGVLAATHLAGLLAVALTVADPRRAS